LVWLSKMVLAQHFFFYTKLKLAKGTAFTLDWARWFVAPGGLLPLTFCSF
jgi:hypothetical protein